MDNNKIIKAFTLVEIMFVVAIIAFLSVSGVNYFNGFVDSKRIESEFFIINNKIDTLNSKVKNKEIYDYEINFSGSKDYLSYKLNQSVKKSDTILFIDKNTKNYTLSSSLMYTGTWEVSIYNLNKQIFTKILDQRNIINGSMKDYQSYDIVSNFENGEDLLGIMYFSEDNLTNSGIATNFIGANTNSDRSGNSSNNFTLKNTNSTLSFYSGNTLWDTNEVYLFFEKAGLEKSIKITNN